MKKRKKSSREKRALVGALCTAAVILAGSTFAWFTSQDDVTNRLTATANYGVSIVEDFTPPKEMVPGQEVDKDVSIVNTGSIDAFVRTNLTNILQVSRYSTQELLGASPSITQTGYFKNKTSGEVTKVTAASAGTAPTNPDTNGYDLYYTTYKFTIDDSTIATYLNPTDTVNDAQGLSKAETETALKLTANEVTTLQAGGELVVYASESFAPSGVRSGDDDDIAVVATSNFNDSDYPVLTNGSGKYYINVGDVYYDVTKTAAASTGVNATYTCTATVPTTDTVTPSGLSYEVMTFRTSDFHGSAQFLPYKTGLYLFRRYDVTNGTPTKTYYSGYYYVAQDASGTDAITNAGKGNYYALDNYREAKAGDPEGGDKITMHPYLNTVDNTASNYVTITTDDDGIISSIKNLKLRTKTALQDYTAYFLANPSASPAVLAGAKDENGYYTNAEVKREFLATEDGTALTSAADIKTAKMIKVTYTFGTSDATDDVIFYVKLADNWSTYWTYVEETDVTDKNVIRDKNNTVGYFYYNYRLPAGKTSERLIDSVKLGSAVTNIAFADLVYDLNIHLDSIQITRDETNKQVVDSAKANWKDALGDITNVTVNTGEYVDGAGLEIKASTQDTDTSTPAIKWG